jgi:hypothetical protein
VIAAVRIEFVYARGRKYFRRQRAPLVSRKLMVPRTAGQVLVFAGISVPVVAHGNREAIDFGAAFVVMGMLLLCRTLVIRRRFLRVPDERRAEYRWLIDDDRLEFGTGDTLGFSPPIGRAPKAADGALRRFTITDRAVRAVGAGRSIRWNWAAVTRLEEWPETYVLHQADQQNFPIPRDTLTSSQESELRALFQARGLKIVSGSARREKKGAKG